MTNLSVLPIWKGGETLTAADRLHEIALLAQTSPEKFARMVVVWIGNMPNGNLSFNHSQFGCDLVQQIGMFEVGKSLALEESGA